MMTGDTAGRCWLDPVAQELLNAPEEVTVAPRDWAAAFHTYDPATRMPLESHQLPMYRALSEGRVEHVEVLISPPGGPERVVCVSAMALYDSTGLVLGAVVKGRDITAEWLQRVGVEQTTSCHLCPCDSWQLEAPLGTPLDWIREAVEEHLAECVVLGATRHLVSSA